MAENDSNSSSRNSNEARVFTGVTYDVSTFERVPDFHAKGEKIPMPTSKELDDSYDHFNPPHYMQGKIEVIDFIEDHNLGFHLGNVVKYICRSPFKGTEIRDLKKAAWYLRRFIEIQEKEKK